ncbi:MAG: RsmD family RNA methyltransferase, partial [Chthoniobacterales bacterium]
MRVIAGSAGGVPLLPPPRTTRPTMDKVRAAVFSSLGDAVPDARVLDLYAGSGALGIEALSRGAATATFVDSDSSAVATIRRNLAKTKLTGSVQAMDVTRFLPLYAPPGSFELIFADPPYTKSDADRDFVAELLADPALPLALT